MDSRLSVNGQMLRVRVDGRFGAPWLVFSNSLMTDLSLWDQQVAVFGASHRILRYDTRGHGGSSVPDGACDFLDLVADLAEVMRQVGATGATICGVSMGGVTALGLAARHPDLVARVAVCDCQPAATDAGSAAWDERIALARDGGMAALVEPTAARWLRPETVAANGAVVTAVRHMIGATPLDGFVRAARALQSYDFGPELAALAARRCPIAFVVGADDGALPGVMRAMAEACPGARLTTVPDCGHLPNLERPDAFNDALGVLLSTPATSRAMRLPELTPEQMTSEQRRVADNAVAGKRGRLPAPLRAWLHSPVFGDRAQSLGEFLRYDTSLGPALSELAILVTARFWTSQYEWYAHKALALQAGVDPAVCDAIARREPPSLADAKAELVYEYATTMHRERTVSQALHDRAVGLLGEAGVVELVGILGYYTLVSMTLNGFGIGVPAGEAEELAP